MRKNLIAITLIPFMLLFTIGCSNNNKGINNQQQQDFNAKEIRLLEEELQKQQVEINQLKAVNQMQSELLLQHRTELNETEDNLNKLGVAYYYINQDYEIILNEKREQDRKAAGQAIVDYADQFVGNPYVWGGSSLTNGCDCSHFVWLVLRDVIGYSGGYTTDWEYRGTAVKSLAEAQAGDIICYPSHVAIYDGNGLIVEARSPSAGITHDISVNYTTITAIRRFV